MPLVIVSQTLNSRIKGIRKIKMSPRVLGTLPKTPFPNLNILPWVLPAPGSLLSVLHCLVHAHSELLELWAKLCFPSAATKHLLLNYRVLHQFHAGTPSLVKDFFLPNSTTLLRLDQCYGPNGCERTGQHILPGSESIHLTSLQMLCALSQSLRLHSSESHHHPSCGSLW